MMHRQQNQPTWAVPQSWKHPAATSTLNHYNASPPISVAPKKLKIVCLGGAGAGKTSILRRYFRGTFHHERIPTMGSDFYTKKIPNPNREVNSDLDQPSQEQPTDLNYHEEGDNIEDDAFVEEKKMVDVSHVPPPPPPPSVAALKQHFVIKDDNPFSTAELVSIQVWDTPGRERDVGPNRRKAKYTAAFSDNFFQSADAALLVYDFTSSTSFTQLLHWHADLTERMQRIGKRKSQPQRSLPILIVANKMDLFVAQQQEEQLPHSQQHSLQNGSISSPLKIVQQRDVMGFGGNTFRGKDSRYEYRAGSQTPSSNSSSGHLQRSVSPSSCSHKSTTGPLSPSMSSPQLPNTSSSKSKKARKQRKTNKNHRFEISTYMGTGGQTSYLKAVLSNECVRGSYLESLLSTEDRSHPDKDMVLLWCMRNGLKHVEVSALDGTGVDEMMDEVVKLAMESSTSVNLDSRQKDGTTASSSNIPQPQQLQSQHPQELPDSQSRQAQEEQQLQNYYRRNDELDLVQRYAPKEQCWLLALLVRGPFRFCCKP